VYGRNVRKACDVFGRFLLLVKILCQIGRFTSFTTARFIKRALLLPTMESNYNPDALYTIAINNPAPGIECAVAHEIGQLPTTAEVWSARYSDTLATVSYTQCLPGSDAEPSVKENDPVGQLLESYNLDYLLFSTEGKRDDPIAGILNGALGFLAMGLVQHHQEKAVAGELPIPNTDYHLRVEVTEMPGQRQDEFSYNVNSSAKDYETHSLVHRMPISKTVASKALDKVMARKGIESDAPRGGYMGGNISEQTLRILVKEFSKWGAE